MLTVAFRAICVRRLSGGAPIPTALLRVGRERIRRVPDRINPSREVLHISLSD